MRKLVYSINLSVDGCCDHTKMIAGEDVHDFFTDLLRQGDTFVYGRVTYELMVPFWPDIANDPKSEADDSMKNFAKAYNEVKKIVVFSTTLKKPASDNPTEIIRGNLKEEILRLKREPGGNLLLGGVDIAEQAMKLDLIDEYVFVVQPVIVGEGRRLARGLNMVESLKLKLLEAKTLPSGTIVLRYAKG